MTALRRVSPEETRSLVEQFHRFFDVDFAVSQQQKNAVYGVRYRVYCEEQNFEPSSNFPDRMERDEFDDKSLHCLITHKASGIHAGCVRVVGTGGRRQTDLLPYEKHCPESVDPDFFRAKDLKRESICEVSRLAVDPRFRRRPAAGVPAAGVPAAGVPAAGVPAAGVPAEVTYCAEEQFSQEEIRTFPLIATAGFLSATALSDISARNNVFSLMQPFLPRLMRHAGFIFQRAGKPVEYHGNRVAYYCKTEWAVRKLRPELREFYESIHARIDQAYRVLDGWPYQYQGSRMANVSGTHLHLVGGGSPLGPARGRTR
jgi:N-acyl-L-homoserine lactone synthetase